MHAHQVDKDGPVTVIVTRIAKRDKIREFEEWMDGIIHEAMKFEGHMGVNVIRPSDLSNPEYVIIFRFNTFENLAKWENSEVRREWLAKSKEVAEGEPVVEKQTGLEFWFTPRSRTGRSVNGDKAPTPIAPPPPRYKMAIVITAVIFISIHLAPTDKTAHHWSPYPLKYIHRSSNNGFAYDLCDNAVRNKIIGTLVVQEEIILRRLIVHIPLLNLLFRIVVDYEKEDLIEPIG